MRRSPVAVLRRGGLWTLETKGKLVRSHGCRETRDATRLCGCVWTTRSSFNIVHGNGLGVAQTLDITLTILTTTRAGTTTTVCSQEGQDSHPRKVCSTIAVFRGRTEERQCPQLQTFPAQERTTRKVTKGCKDCTWHGTNPY